MSPTVVQQRGPMFEATILLTLLGLIIWFTLSKGQSSSTQRTYFINLTAELKPPAKKADKCRHS